MAPSVVVAIHAPCWPGDPAVLARPSKRKSSRMFSATSLVEEC